MSTTYENGVLNSSYIYYHPSGEIDFKGKYKNNLRIGEWIYFSEEGKKDTIINYNE